MAARRDPTIRHLVLANAVIVAVTTAGAAAFVVDGEHPLDAIYRAVNTVTTAGMVHPPTSTGTKLTTIALLISGVVAFLYIIGLLLELVVGGVASGLWQRRRMDVSIAALRGHHVICGYGRVGTRVVRDLVASGGDVVVIDTDPATLERAREDGLLYLQGDGSDEETLTAAGIESAASLVACADDDAENTYVVLTA
jgi:voltage-gated potassium channel